MPIQSSSRDKAAAAARKAALVDEIDTARTELARMALPRTARRSCLRLWRNLLLASVRWLTDTIGILCRRLWFA